MATVKKGCVALGAGLTRGFASFTAWQSGNMVRNL